jgi:hypothetical protein
MGIGDWGLGIGDWANPQSPNNKNFYKNKFLYFFLEVHTGSGVFKL